MVITNEVAPQVVFPALHDTQRSLYTKKTTARCHQSTAGCCHCSEIYKTEQSGRPSKILCNKMGSDSDKLVLRTEVKLLSPVNVC